MKKLIALLLVIAMVMGVSITASATTVEAPGDVNMDVTGSYVAGYESNGIVYCVDIAWENLDFTYYAEKGAVWNPETLKYSNVEKAHWAEGTGTITVTNRSNTKITAVPEYTPEDGYQNANMSFDTALLRVASAESGTAQSGTITVTPSGYLPAMEESATIGVITITIAQDTDVTVAEAAALIQRANTLTAEAHTLGKLGTDEGDVQIQSYYDAINTGVFSLRMAAEGSDQEALNRNYKDVLMACDELEAYMKANYNYGA